MFGCSSLTITRILTFDSPSAKPSSYRPHFSHLPQNSHEFYTVLPKNRRKGGLPPRFLRFRLAGFSQETSSLQTLLNYWSVTQSNIWIGGFTLRFGSLSFISI